MKRLAIAVALSALFSGAAFAQQGNLQRDANQQQRIEQGVKSGQLTDKEAARLEKREAHIQRTQARAMSDGTETKAEKAHIAREQDRASRAIYRQKHDAQTQ